MATSFTDYAKTNGVQLGGAYAPKPTVQSQQNKGPGGIAGFLVNSLPAITSGVGAVGGSFLAPGAGTVAGGAAGGALGEFLKRKILGQKEDIGQIATQGIEGGALSGIGAAGRGLKAGATALTQLGKTAAEKEVAPAAEKAGGTFLKNLTTQGRQKQANTAGISFGSSAKGATIESPQESEKILQTLKSHNIPTGNANTTGKALKDKLDQYGKQISDHFKTNNAPLHPEDVDVIADNYLKSIKTTDPAVLEKAQIEVNDLKKNVKSTKDLWEYRKTLDKEIPGSKQTSDENLSNKVSARKSMRQYISDELGDVPGMKEYHDLSEAKPFVTKEGNRLNNPTGGALGRILASGPVQKGEDLLGKAMEKTGTKLAGVPVGGKTENAVGKGTEKVAQKLAGGAEPPPPPTGGVPEADLQAASDAAGTVGAAPAVTSTPNLAQKFIGAAANPVANPGQTGKAIIKQEAGRGFGIPASVANGQQSSANNTPDLSGSILQASSNSPAESSSPYAPENAEANVQAILQQGGTQKDVSDYLANVKNYQALQNASGSTPAFGKPTAQQHALAQSAVGSLQQLADMIEKDPSILNKNATPGQGTPLVGSLITNAAGAGGYHPLADNILSSLIHLQTGATATKEEITAAHGQLPQPGDSAEERAQKIQTLLSNFEPFLSGQ